MPVYEYFCPSCTRELEVLRPIQSADEFSDCPDCGGKAWRLVSGFGSRTGSYVQPAGMPFRDMSGWKASRGETVATVARSSADARSMVDDRQASSAVEMSWLLESQPNGSNIWFIQDWGIASIMRYLREDSDAKTAEVAPASPAQSPIECAPGFDQRIESPSAKPWLDERMAESPTATEPAARPADVPMVAYAPSWVGDQSGEPDMHVEPDGRAAGALLRHWLPTRYFGWFVLMVACIAAIVVPLVWFLAVPA